MDAEKGGWTESGRELDRLVFFSDAVFAIAITLLVLNIRIPDVAHGAQLAGRLVGLLPKVYSYLLSFAVIASFWIAHHRMFHHIKRFDARLIWLNFLFLLFVAFLPFPSALLGEYGGEWISFAVYCSAMVATGLSLTLLWLYATHRRRFVSEDLDREVIKEGTTRGLSAPVVFLVALAISFFNRDVGGWSILVGFLVLRFYRRFRESRRS